MACGLVYSVRSTQRWTFSRKAGVGPRFLVLEERLDRLSQYLLYDQHGGYPPAHGVRNVLNRFSQRAQLVPNPLPESIPCFLGRAFQFGVHQRPLANITVKLLDHPEVPPTTTDTLGRFRMPNIPPDPRLAFRFSHLNYQDQLLLIDGTIGTWEIAPTEMPMPWMNHMSHWMLGTRVKPATGGIIAFVIENPICTTINSHDRLAGATFKLYPSPPGSKVTYLNNRQLPTWFGRRTSRSGLALFFNIPPGEYELESFHPEGDILPTMDMWPGDAGRVTIRVEAGAMSDTHPFLRPYR